MDKNNEKKEKKEKELIKISMFSKNENIRRRFLKEIKASGLLRGPKGLDLGSEFAVFAYQTTKIKYVFQLWSISSKSRFEEMIPEFILGSRGIIYFYNITDKIEEHRLKLVKNVISPGMYALFVGYDSTLPKNPEQSDDNIRLIKKYFGDFNSLYISVEKPDSWFEIVDRLISLERIMRR